MKKKIKKIRVSAKTIIEKYNSDFSKFAEEKRKKYPNIAMQIILSKNNLKKMQQYIVENHKLLACCDFAHYVKGADIKKLQDVVLRYGDYFYCYYFARYVEGAEIESLEKRVIDSKNLNYCCKFAANVKGANIEKLQKVIIDSKSAFYCYTFAHDVKNVSIQPLQQAIIDSKNYYYCFELARNIKGANIKALTEAIIDSENKKLCFDFAVNISGTDIISLKKIFNKDKYLKENFEKLQLSNYFTSLENLDNYLPKTFKEGSKDFKELAKLVALYIKDKTVNASIDETEKIVNQEMKRFNKIVEQKRAELELIDKKKNKINSNKKTVQIDEQNLNNSKINCKKNNENNIGR